MSMQIIELLQEANLEPFCYSGRGMFGRNCVAVDATPQHAFFCILSRMGEEGKLPDFLDDLAQAVVSAKTDALGSGTVTYFPTVPWPTEEMGS